MFLVPCGRLSQLYVSFWAQVNLEVEVEVRNLARRVILKDDRTAWADVEAIQLLLSTCFLYGWDATSLTIGEVSCDSAMLTKI